VERNPSAPRRARRCPTRIRQCRSDLAAPVTAGAVSDFPEFPYPHTNYDEPYRGQYHFSARYGWIMTRTA
jgi:fructan beta-fructosidase